MSKLSTSTVKKILSLARLNHQPTLALLEKYVLELDAILNVVDQLQQIDTTQISATAALSKTRIAQLREDKPSENPEKYQRIRKNIIQNFPQKQGDFLALPVKIL